MDRIWKNGPTSAQKYISSRYSQKQLSSSRNDYRLTSGTYSSIFNAAPILVLWESRK